MKTEKPSSRWFKKWELAHVSFGGHNGPETLKAMRPRAQFLYQCGATAYSAGSSTAEEYKLHTALNAQKEINNNQKQIKDTVW